MTQSMLMNEQVIMLPNILFLYDYETAQYTNLERPFQPSNPCHSKLWHINPMVRVLLG